MPQSRSGWPSIPAFTCTLRQPERPGSTWSSASFGITEKRLRRGVFKSVGELETAIMDYLDQHNAHPKPFVWTKSAGEILEKVARAKQR